VIELASSRQIKSPNPTIIAEYTVPVARNVNGCPNVSLFKHHTQDRSHYEACNRPTRQRSIPTLHEFPLSLHCSDHFYKIYLKVQLTIVGTNVDPSNSGGIQH